MDYFDVILVGDGQDEAEGVERGRPLGPHLADRDGPGPARLLAGLRDGSPGRRPLTRRRRPEGTADLDRAYASGRAVRGDVLGREVREGRHGRGGEASGAYRPRPSPHRPGAGSVRLANHDGATAPPYASPTRSNTSSTRAVW